MYPRLSDLFIDLFGFELPFPIYSFGAMVALGVLTGAWLAGKELDRLYAEKRLKSVRVTVEKNDKGKKGRKKRVTEEASPSVLMGNITIMAVVAGFAGSKLFHILENLDEFFLDPFGMLFSTGGFTFYGGLIVAGITITWYLRKKGQTVALFADALAPGLMIAYGIGRMGCHLSGDGDWGIAADVTAKPGWMPMWLWAEDYANNILGVDLSTAPVYPTPIYEFAAGLLLFGLLWKLRTHPFLAGWLFWFYFIVNGLERFFIEKIRVNNTFEFMGMNITQAEVIALVLVLVGVVGVVKTMKKRAASPLSPAA